MRNLLVLAAATLGMGLAAQAMGSVVYSYASDKSSLNDSKGTAPVTVNLYLKETRTAGSASIIAGDSGLAGAGLEVVRTTGNAAITAINFNTADFAGLTTMNVAAGDTSFDETVSLSATTGVNPGNTGGGASPNTPSDSVYLGSMTITPGTDPSTFKLQPIPGGGNTVTFNSSFDLDATSTNPAFTGVGDPSNPLGSFVVQGSGTVPEPASMSLLVLGGMGLIARRRK